MDEEVTVRTTRDRIAQLLQHEVDEVKLEVWDAGSNPVPLAEVEYDMRCTIAGIVRSVDDIHHFTRQDGEDGQVRNIQIQDSTSMIRCALWGDHADVELPVGEPVILENVEIQDGWQDDIEASVGWQASIEELDEPDIEFVRVQLVEDAAHDDAVDPDTEDDS